MLIVLRFVSGSLRPRRGGGTLNMFGDRGLSAVEFCSFVWLGNKGKIVIY